MKTNKNNKIFLATVPSGTTDDAKKYKQIKYITEFTTNLSYKKEDLTYLHNNGDTTSYITGRTLSFSVTVTLNNNDDVHNYLIGLANGVAQDLNNQYIYAEIDTAKTANKRTKIKGKCAIEIKSYPPTGKADELQMFQFDILPQDDSFTSEEIS